MALIGSGRVLVVGVAFEVQRYEESLPHDQYDQKLDMLLTEEELIVRNEQNTPENELLRDFLVKDSQLNDSVAIKLI